ncbi:MAG TPA: RimK family alpha-L-glutamate ligase, partial [Candidatus Saccharimonadales bacterium]|nr:RimK family alpha-L-glutamate ligase [Candidatus Saccharimonadales bacterium]
DLVLNREIGQTRAELILDYIEAMGVKTINSSASTTLCNNKILSTQILEQKGIPVPVTKIAFSQSMALEAAGEIGYPIVIKPVWGSWGRLVSKISSGEDLEAIMDHKEGLGGPQHSIFYIQQYIKKPDRDIRVFVIGGEPIAAMYRSSTHWLTNTAKGGIPQKLDLNKEIIDLCKHIVEVLGVEMAGVDLVEHDNKYLVFEVNTTPEFHGLNDVSDVNIAESMVEYITRLH